MKRLLIFILLLLVLASCTKVSLTSEIRETTDGREIVEDVEAEINETISIYETPEKVESDITEETEVESFGEVI